ncbi:cellulase family glycosylhydrolase [Dinghuibacter silviterrae]|uniref:Carbohydrate binding protein with CBM6 domain n=1 Tax=Dinghuibacter silviterrae TaxID=1539049 RepID=A0A4V3GLW6_9BACT|nr:cellulase family glycosylhydrolase [Dinghuibacter silviterrae]TDX01163.1 carbohydrate binding protein with CBM6 domain [Dinghuibacter silviterrae]
MKKATRLSLILWVALAGLGAGQARCQGFLHREGDRIADGRHHEVILRGIGLGGWMLQEPYMLRVAGVAVNQTQIRARISDLVGPEKTDAFYASWRAHQTTRADIDSLASWGFNAVRVPLHFNLFTLPIDQEPVPGRNTWLPTGFTLLDSLLRWCRVDHIYLILDLHAAPGGQGNDIAISDRDKQKPSLWQSPYNQQKTVALWRKLAERYGRDPWIGGYDLLNETNWGFSDPADEHGCSEKDNGPLRSLLIRVTDTIRAVDKQHLIFIEGNCWANNFHGLLPPWDSNMAVSFHKYWNYNDQASIQGVIDLRTRYNIPLWLGESGENSNTWTTDAIALVESNHISWTWWPLKKAGVNNPLEFHFPPGWPDIIAYWEGKGPKPSATEAYAVLMQLASGSSVARNTYHKDVIDAMFRQVHSDKTLPFQPASIPARVYGANYDLGRNGFAYYDLDTANFRTSNGINAPWNRGGYYRNDGVDITLCTDTGSMGYAVTDIEPGEWMQYTVRVPRSGYYTVSYRVEAAPVEPIHRHRIVQPSSADTPSAAAAANATAGLPANTPAGAAAGAARAATNGNAALLSDAAYAAPSWQLLDYDPVRGEALLDERTLPADAAMLVPGASPAPWVSIGKHRIYLKAGVHHLRILARAGGFNFSYIAIE